ncbi:MAG: hypothetical protein H2069_00235 [Legionella sp.]|nr:hypothetical protein [Legionella sp.]
MDHCYKTFVSLGNSKQYFPRLIKLVLSCATLLPRPIFIQHGHTPLDYAQNQFFESPFAHFVEFLPMDIFIEYVNNADVLVGHAGAGFILHALKAQKHPLVMARRACLDEVVNDHQVIFARQLHLQKKVTIIEDSNTLNIALNNLAKKKVAPSSKQMKAQQTLDNQLRKILA